MVFRILHGLRKVWLLFWIGGARWIRLAWRAVQEKGFILFSWRCCPNFALSFIFMPWRLLVFRNWWQIKVSCEIGRTQYVRESLLFLFSRRRPFLRFLETIQMLKRINYRLEKKDDFLCVQTIGYTDRGRADWSWEDHHKALWVRLFVRFPSLLYDRQYYRGKCWSSYSSPRDLPLLWGTTISSWCASACYEPISSM